MQFDTCAMYVQAGQGKSECPKKGSRVGVQGPFLQAKPGSLGSIITSSPGRQHHHQHVTRNIPRKHRCEQAEGCPRALFGAITTITIAMGGKGSTAGPRVTRSIPRKYRCEQADGCPRALFAGKSGSARHHHHHHNCYRAGSTAGPG